MTDYAIKAIGLTKRFQSERREVVAVDDLNFQVPSGSVTGLLGGNGAGKTTTISMLLGLLLPSSGLIEVLGHNMATDRYAALPRMNFSSPYVELPHRLTVEENLTVYGNLYGIRGVRQRVRAVAAELDLLGVMGRPTGRLSAGQKTRVTLAKALLNEPEVLLLDEPTASLDPDTADWIRGYLQEYQRCTGATILLASHNMLEVERMCGSVLMMRGGKLVDQGAPDDLIARYGRSTMEEVFLDIARSPAERIA